MHAASTFDVMRVDDRKCDVLANLTKEQFLEVRKTIIKMILATDMVKHMTTTSTFENKSV
jgi:hypothetical protein